MAKDITASISWLIPSFARRNRSRFPLLDPTDAPHESDASWPRAVPESHNTGFMRALLEICETLSVRIPHLARHTIIYRISPLILIPTIFIILIYSFSGQQSRDFSVYHDTSSKSGLDSFETAPRLQMEVSDRFHAEPLKPIQFDPGDITIRKAVVLASYKKQDTKWTKDLDPSWETYRYVLDDPHPADGFAVPRNQGREAMAYLTFIIDHYDSLPNFVVFHHGSYNAWHQPEPSALKIQALNLSALSHDHYVNLRCAHRPGCTKDSIIDLATGPGVDDQRVQAHMLPKFWNTFFGNESTWDLGPPPTRLSVPCCAQFAVTREAILSRPLQFWKTYRKPLVNDFAEIKPIWGPMTNSYYVGICYEKVWHMIFGKPETYCPSEDYCRKIQFSDAIVCDRYIGPYDDSAGWELVRCVNRPPNG